VRVREFIVVSINVQAGDSFSQLNFPRKVRMDAVLVRTWTVTVEDHNLLDGRSTVRGDHGGDVEKKAGVEEAEVGGKVFGNIV
jgi:hypothetical protein